MNFFQKKKIAEREFGTASTRPQDSNPNLMRQTRALNNMMPPLQHPNDYEKKIDDWIAALCIDMTNIFDSVPNTSDVILINSTHTFNASLIGPQIMSSTAIGLDFEFHTDQSFDGFICLVSITTSAGKTAVFDCLADDREVYIDVLKQVFESSNIVKITHGSDNDLLRLQKDWRCFAVAVIDLQDLFLVWKSDSEQVCWRESKEVIRQYLYHKGKLRGDPVNACEEFFEMLAKPSYDLLRGITLTSKLVSKDETATLADWRVRPIPHRLIQYAGGDTAFLLPMFVRLFTKTGLTGIKRAASITKQKLIKLGELRQHRRGPHDIMPDILEWREYLARQFDFQPFQVLPDANLRRLEEYIRTHGGQDISGLASILEELSIKDSCTKAAKLLAAYTSADRMTKDKEKGQLVLNANGEVRHVFTTDIFSSDHLILATILDPRLKKFPFEMDADQNIQKYRTPVEKAVTALEKAYQDIRALSQDDIYIASANEVPTPALVGKEIPPPRKKPKTIMQLLKEAQQKEQELKQAESGQQAHQSETEVYLSEPRKDITDNPLAFWRQNESRFPYLSKLARIYLAFPATSGSIERLFSVAGSIARARRARITIENLENVLCYRDNMEDERQVQVD